MNEVNVRYLVPTKYDVARYGTITKVMGEGDNYELFVQLGADETQPNWKPMSYLLEKAFSDYLLDKDFISYCLSLYSRNGDRLEQFKNISNLLVK